MIRLSHVFKRYKMAGHMVTALNDVSLEIKKGEFVSIVGRSGSGKSTLMNIIGCLDKPCEGDYFLDGCGIIGQSSRVLAKTRNQKIGFVFQNFNLISYLSAWENIELPLIYRKAPLSMRKKLVAEALEAVGLSERASHKPSELSGGQQQRVAIARAIAARPPIILADEPCGNLDSKMGNEIMRIFTELNQEGRTIVLITHDPTAAKQASRLINIADGKMVTNN